MSGRDPAGGAAAGAAYAVAAYGLWGLAPVYWKALAALPTSQILAHRALWSFAVGLALVFLTRAVPEVRETLRSARSLGAMLCSAALLGTSWLVYIWAVETDRVLDTSLGYYVNPLISVVFGMGLLGERLRRAQIAAVLLATAGVAQLAIALGELPWISLVLAGTFALYGLVRKVAPVRPVVGFSVETALLAPLGGAYLFFGPGAGSESVASSPVSVQILVACTGIFTAAPLLCFNSAAKRLRLSTIGLFQFLAPTLSFLLAVTVYGEAFTRAHGITFACVWLALCVYVFDSVRAARGL